MSRPFRPAVQAITVLYSTDFNTPTYADGGIIGQDRWIITGASVVAPVSVANTATNETVTLATTGQDVRRLFTPAVTTDSVFLKVDITVASAQATGDYFVHFGDRGASNFYNRVYIRSSGAGFVMALSTSSGAVTYGTDVLNLGTTYTIPARYDINAGLANDSGALFVNPTTIDGIWGYGLCRGDLDWCGCCLHRLREPAAGHRIKRARSHSR